MKLLPILLSIFVLSFSVISCKSKAISPEDFIKMENEFLGTDLSEKSKETIVEKYGFTVKDYNEFASKVESDEKLRQKLGEIRLKNTQKK